MSEFRQGNPTFEETRSQTAGVFVRFHQEESARRAVEHFGSSLQRGEAGVEVVTHGVRVFADFAAPLGSWVSTGPAANTPTVSITPSEKYEKAGGTEHGQVGESAGGQSSEAAAVVGATDTLLVSNINFVVTHRAMNSHLYPLGLRLVKLDSRVWHAGL